jgi:hypothetical protein
MPYWAGMAGQHSALRKKAANSLLSGLSQIIAFNGLFTKLGEIPLPM